MTNHTHRKTKRSKILAKFKKRLGIQSSEENIVDILEKAIKRIDLLEFDNYEKERQITTLLRDESNTDLQKQIDALKQENLKLKSGDCREALIKRLRNQVECLKLESENSKQQINDLKLQLWPLYHAV